MNKIVILIILVLYIILCTLSILVFNDIFPIEVTVGGGGGGGGNDVFFNVSVVQGSSNILQIITKKQRRFVLTKPL